MNDLATKVIQGARLKTLNDKDVKDGEYILYWMQCSQRSEYNRALEYAIQRANNLRKSLFKVGKLIQEC